MKVELHEAGYAWLGAAVLQLTANILLGLGRTDASPTFQAYASLMWLIATLAQVQATPDIAYNPSKYFLKTGNPENLCLLIGSLVFIASDMASAFSGSIPWTAGLAAVGAFFFFIAACVNLTIPDARLGAIAFVVGAVVTIVNTSWTAVDFSKSENVQSDRPGLWLGLGAGVCFVTGGLLWSGLLSKKSKQTSDSLISSTLS